MDEDLQGWLDVAARQLGVDGLTQDEVTALLDLARDVAHNTERRYAPLTCFLVGVAAGRDRQQVVERANALGALATEQG